MFLSILSLSFFDVTMCYEINDIYIYSTGTRDIVKGGTNNKSAQAKRGKIICTDFGPQTFFALD